ncbi:hypothetical protein [Acinetobacter sp. WZC-1]|uniref:hypothetical protein n=1 Tax=Acinetobacter sp. WZC-1 TaxID=3459034 RepID=UPI00403DC07B
MSSRNPREKKVVVNLPFPVKKVNEPDSDEVLEELRPKPQRYADRTWMPPRGTRRSMGKR